MAVIRLGVALPRRSSHLPADLASSLGLNLVVRLLGVAPDGGCRVSPAPDWLNTRPGRLVSVALFLAFDDRSRDRLIAAGRYPASCSAEPGLSSPRTGFHRRAATVWLASDANGSTARAFHFCGRTPSLHYASRRQRIVSPARRGTTLCSPNGYDAGTTHASRLSVMVALLRGRP